VEAILRLKNHLILKEIGRDQVWKLDLAPLGVLVYEV
jgi:hypothetical protein